MSSLDDLIQKRLHGLATPEELAELDALLARSPESAAAYARATRLDFALHRHYREERAVSSVQQQVRRVRRRRWMRIAAAFLVAALAGLFLVRIRSPLAMNGDLALGAGDSVEGPAMIAYPGESTSLRLDPGSVLVLEASDPGKRAFLKKGRLFATVDPQAEPFVIRTPDARATVLGTRFTLSVEARFTRLEVTRGKVKLARGEEKID
ncbi:MAG TPA: FecR domain-containing protein, partial [Planctomycetota bacterium]|nr:FecR domain-containing protein [Planctomycetota bacterium]